MRAVYSFSDREILYFCERVAYICASREFKQLQKEITKLYKRQGISDYQLRAFQDSLFSLYMEQSQDEEKPSRSFT